MLREIALITRNAFVVEVNIPTMKKLPHTSTDVTVSDIETVVVGDKAAQGALGIRQISRKLLNALLEMSQNGMNQTINKSEVKNSTAGTLKPLVPSSNSTGNSSSVGNNSSSPSGVGGNSSSSGGGSSEEILSDYARRKAQESLRAKLELLYREILDLSGPATPPRSPEPNSPHKRAR